MAMFDNCSKIKAIVLSSFVCAKVNWLNSIFNCCHELEYIDIQNIKERLH